MLRRLTSLSWKPTIGGLAHYASRHSGLTREGCPVRVLAEASGARMYVEIIGHAGALVRITVKASNLHPMPPSLFDGTEFSM
jgi:hypothetical protein